MDFFDPFLKNVYFLLLETPSLNSYVETWIPSVVVLGGGAFGKWLSHEDGTIMNEVNAFIKEKSPPPAKKKKKSLALEFPWQSSG